MLPSRGKCCRRCSVVQESQHDDALQTTTTTTTTAIVGTGNRSEVLSIGEIHNTAVCGFVAWNNTDVRRRHKHDPQQRQEQRQRQRFFDTEDFRDTCRRCLRGLLRPHGDPAHGWHRGKRRRRWVFFFDSRTDRFRGTEGCDDDPAQGHQHVAADPVRKLGRSGPRGNLVLQNGGRHERGRRKHPPGVARRRGDDISLFVLSHVPDAAGAHRRGQPVSLQPAGGPAGNRLQALQLLEREEDAVSGIPREPANPPGKGAKRPLQPRAALRAVSAGGETGTREAQEIGTRDQNFEGGAALFQEIVVSDGAQSRIVKH
mmetsp:Transcript_75194/g.152621  ORF Transcript_75194/g.152621 Transcript_75194/m.152621 type:complete len:315 (+) Transcript_75194:237-1181(+)